MCKFRSANRTLAFAMKPELEFLIELLDGEIYIFCIYIYIHMYIHMNIYIYIYIYSLIYGTHLGTYQVLGTNQTFHNVQKVNGEIKKRADARFGIFVIGS